MRSDAVGMRALARSPEGEPVIEIRARIQRRLHAPWYGSRRSTSRIVSIAERPISRSMIDDRTRTAHPGVRRPRRRRSVGADGGAHARREVRSDLRDAVRLRGVRRCLLHRPHSGRVPRNRSPYRHRDNAGASRLRAWRTSWSGGADPLQWITNIPHSRRRRKWRLLARLRGSVACDCRAARRRLAW